MNPKKDLKAWKKEQQLVYPNPDCEYCNNYERFMDKMKVFLLIANILIGGMLIYYVRHDVQSQCCQKYKEMAEQIETLYGPGVATIKPQDVKEIINGPQNMDSGNFSIGWMPEE